MLIIQFSEEIFDNNNSSNSSNFDILKNIDFEEIRNLNFAYIQSLKESVQTSLLFSDEDAMNPY